MISLIWQHYQLSQLLSNKKTQHQNIWLNNNCLIILHSYRVHQYAVLRWVKQKVNLVIHEILYLASLAAVQTHAVAGINKRDSPQTLEGRKGGEQELVNAVLTGRRNKDALYLMIRSEYSLYLCWECLLFSPLVYTFSLSFSPTLCLTASMSLYLICFSLSPCVCPPGL